MLTENLLLHDWNKRLSNDWVLRTQVFIFFAKFGDAALELWNTILLYEKVYSTTVS